MSACGRMVPMLTLKSITPPLPKSLHRFPVSASSATSLASAVAVTMRFAHWAGCCGWPVELEAEE